MTDNIVPIIIICIIVIQLYFFIKNIIRMMVFRNIFEEEESWKLSYNSQDFVSGISGDGNTVFDSIILSINKYLGNNTGSVIDFQLLKDAVDRHSDSVEEEISTQTPVPLYCGLAGTMAGVICGLFPLINSGALIYLLSGNIPDSYTKETMDLFAATGINDLLTGVAWAMVSSIFGILLTTINSLVFKSHKLKEERGKSSFLAWMQSSLLPKLPSDTSDALNKLVKNLNHFNSVFATNTSELKSTLNNVNEVYKSQSDIIQSVKDMDFMKMAKANVRVLQELQECTNQIDEFSRYLTSINEYTATIEHFTERFDSESNRLYVLQEIRDFFYRHKGEIAKETADADNALQTALNTLKQASEKSFDEFNKDLVNQSELFKEIIQEEKNTFEQFAKEINKQFTNQLQQMPMLQQNLERISIIPIAIDKLISSIEQSNTALSNHITNSINNLFESNTLIPPSNGGAIDNQSPDSPKWMKLTIIFTAIIIAAATVTNTVFIVKENIGTFSPSDSAKNQKDSLSVHQDAIQSTSIDSIATVPHQKKVLYDKK